MKSIDQLEEFVRQGLVQGQGADAMRAAMQQAGWSEAEIDRALEAWVSAPGLPPVPVPQPYVSAREAFLFGLLFISLGAVTFNIVTLGSELIELILHDPQDSGYFSAGLARWSIAMLIAFLPLFMFLNSRVNRAEIPESWRRRSLVRRWFAAITLLISCIVLLGDLVATVYALLSGDMTLKFALRALLVALVAGLVLAYYRDELND